MDGITHSLIRAFKASFTLTVSTLKKVLPTFIKRPIRRTLQYTLRFLRTYITPDHCPVALPWFQIRDPKKGINNIHRLAFELEGGQQLLPLKILIYAITWPTSSIIRAVFYTLYMGSRIKKIYSVGLWRQFIKMVYLAIYYNITAKEFFDYRLFNKHSLNTVGMYIQFHEICLLLPWINRNINTEIIHNKKSFYSFCEEKNIPTAAVIAAFDGLGEETWFEKKNHLPNSNLISKPAGLWCGRDVQKWTYHPNTGNYLSDNIELAQSQLLNYFRKISAEEPLIVQPALRNHQSIHDLSAGGLCTLRVVTYRVDGEEPTYLSAILRMPVGDKVTDNMNAGGISAELKSDGRLGNAYSKDPCIGIFSRHPTTNGLIEGRKLENWQEMIELALKTHRNFAETSAIGWDIALTEFGPVVLEGNPTWGADIMQIPQNRPLGETSFPKLFEATS